MAFQSFVGAEKFSEIYIILHYITLWCHNSTCRSLRVAAHMIGGIPKFGHISVHMWDVLNWLLVKQRIHYKISSVIWYCVVGSVPVCLWELIIPTSACSGHRSLHSAFRGDSVTPLHSPATTQNRAFSIVVPLFGIASPLTWAAACRSEGRLFQTEGPRGYIDYSRLSTLTKPE